MTTITAVVILAILGFVIARIKISNEKKAAIRNVEKAYDEKHFAEMRGEIKNKSKENKKWCSVKLSDLDIVENETFAGSRPASTITFYKNCALYDVEDLEQEENIRVAFVISRNYKWPKNIVPETNKFNNSYIDRLYALFMDGKKNLNTPPKQIKADIDQVPGIVINAYDKARKPIPAKAPPSDLEIMVEAQAKQQVALENATPKPKDASVVGRAAAGAVIAGPTGAVVGALSAVDKNNRNKK